MENLDDNQELAELASKIRAWLKETRKARGITQREIGEALGLGKATYTQMENGKLPISLDRLLIITKILGINVLDKDFATLAQEFDQYRTDLKDKMERIERIKDDVEQAKIGIEQAKDDIEHVKDLLNSIVQRLNDSKI
ncbi:MAG: helix-turn-helix transcriptional regulator [Bacteroidia bacterium]|nr:helix-turn-helix transcriptional regulator [Bacteroidia bacterium]